VFAFAPLVLSADLASRGGTKDRVRVLIEKAQLFSRGDFDTLVARAQQAAATHGPNTRGQQEAFPVEDERWSAGMATDASAETVSDERVQAASRLAQRGLHAKAVRSLEAAKIAPNTPETAAALACLHPAGAPVPAELLTPPGRHSGTDGQPSELDLMTLLRVMRNSAAGMSRLFPSLLLQLMSVPGTQLQVGLAGAVADIARGDVPADARPFLFGARLVALVKKQGGVRPIACGDVFRRLAGKWLCAKVRREASTFFGSLQQAGVCVERGAEGLVHTVRRWCGANAGDPAAALLKVDWANAFNSVSRGALLTEVHTHFPVLSEYAVAAYGTPSLLLFGADMPIASTSGVQQGDPLGPLFFSLVLARMWLAIRNSADLPPGLGLAGWYLDDGVISGPPASLLEMLTRIEREGNQVGLLLNRSKCELRLHPSLDGTGPGFSQVGIIGALCDTTLLGCAVGGQAAHEMLGAQTAEKVARKLGLISRIGEVHTHSALATLRLCGGFPMCSHLLRTGGGFAAMAIVDRATRQAFTSVVVACGDASWAQAQLPFRLGGFGVRLLAPHASAASFASSFASLGCPALYCAPTLPADPLLLSSANAIAAAHPTLASFIASLQRGEAFVTGGKVQRHLSHAIEDLAADALLAAAAPAAAARLQSTRRDNASGWLAVCDTEAGAWLSDAEFRIASRLRLGLPVRDGPCFCPSCDTQVEADGYHMLACKSGKHRVHNAVRDRLHQLCCEALLPAHREGRPFASQGEPHADRRIDVVVPSGPDGRALLLDVAVTSPFTASSVAHAANAPGGAATSYERVKLAQYAGAIQPQVHNFVPVVLDSLGAWGRTAIPTLRYLAGAYAQRRAETHGDAWRGRGLFYASLSLTLQRHLARVILRCVAEPALEAAL
jgi:hypothetical protein